MSLKMLSVSEFRKQLSSEFLTALKNNPLTLLSHSRPVAVVMDYETYEVMQLELARLREKRFQELAAALRQAMQTQQSGDTSKVKTLEDLFTNLAVCANGDVKRET